MRLVQRPIPVRRRTHLHNSYFIGARCGSRINGDDANLVRFRGVRSDDYVFAALGPHIGVEFGLNLILTSDDLYNDIDSMLLDDYFRTLS